MTALDAFRHVTSPLRVHYGDDCLEQLPVEIGRANCRRAVILCGQSIVRDRNGLAMVRAALGELCVGVFDGVRAHSPLPSVMAAVDALRRHDADAIVAVGGGSTVVSARAASILLAEGKDIHELCTRFEPGHPPFSPKLLRPKLPQFVVPTTPTTAYAKAGAAVVDPEAHRRLALFDPKTRAQALFFSPSVALTAPPLLVRDAALNAFVMAVQGLESATREPLADALLLHAIRLVRDYLPRLEAEPGSADIRGQLMLAALLSGQGTDYTSGGLASAIGHCVGARFAAEQGVINAILLPHTIRFNAPATAERLAQAAEILVSTTQVPKAGAAVMASRAVEAFFGALGLPSRLRDVGVTKEALPQIAADAGTDWFLFQNPRPLSDPTALLGVLTAAW